MTKTKPQYGDRARGKCTATGRYIGADLVLIVSVDNYLLVDHWDPDGDEPHPTLPVPSDDALAGAASMLPRLRGKS